LPSIFSISITYFLVLLALFAVSYGIGFIVFRTLIRVELKGFYSDFFLKSLIGVSILILLASLFYSKCNTINFIFIFIGLFLFYEFYLCKKEKLTNHAQSQPDKINSFTFKNIYVLLFIVFVCFLWQAIVTLKLGSFPINKIERDSFYYAEISKLLIQTGIENSRSNYNLVGQSYHFSTPYHYYDLWLNGIVGQIFNLNFTLSLYLIVYSFFSGIFLIGILSCTENAGSVKWKTIAFLILLLFVSGIHFSENLPGLANYYAWMPGITERCYGGKLIPVYCFALCSLILFVLNKKTRSGLIVLLCLPVISISTAPAVLSGLFIYCIYKLFKKENRTFYFRMLAYTVIISGCIFMFYHFQTDSLSHLLDKSLISYTDLTNISFFRIKFYLVELFLKSYPVPFLFLLNHLPFILPLCFLFFKKGVDSQFKSILSLFTIFWFTGLITYNTFYLMDESHQFFTNMIVLWYVVFGFSFIMFYFRYNLKNNIIGTVILFVFIFACVFNAGYSFTAFKKYDTNEIQFSDKYLIEVNKECSAFKTGTKGGIFYDDAFYQNLLIGSNAEYHYMPFVLSPKVYVPFNLTPADPALNKSIYNIEKNLWKSPFNLYLAQQTDYDISKQILPYQIDFIKENKLQYLICHKNTVLDFKNYLQIKTIITDSLSGQRFIILN